MCDNKINQQKAYRKRLNESVNFSPEIYLFIMLYSSVGRCQNVSVCVRARARVNVCVSWWLVKEHSFIHYYIMQNICNLGAHDP